MKKKLLLILLTVSGTALYAGKTGAALGGAAGGFILGRATANRGGGDCYCPDVSSYKQQISDLKGQLKQAKSDAKDAKRDHKKEIKDLKSDHRKEIKALKSEHKKALKAAKDQ